MCKGAQPERKIETVPLDIASEPKKVRHRATKQESKKREEKKQQ